MSVTTTECSAITIRIAESDDDRRAAFPVMAQLRPHLTAGAFLPQLRRMEQQGFRLAILREGARVRAVAGYRILERLVGPVLHVDDLVTEQETRSRGYGRELFDWLTEQAILERCQRLELDSAVWRFDAHRFYLAQRMKIRSHHFSLELREDTALDADFGDRTEEAPVPTDGRAPNPDPPTGRSWWLGVRGLA